MARQSDGSMLTPGTYLSIQTVDSPVTFTKVNGVQDVSGVGHDRPTVRRTELQDTVERYHLGRKDGTQVTVPIIWIHGDAGQSAMEDAYNSGDPATFKVTYPDGSTRVFDALVLTFPEAVPDNEHLMINATLKIATDITKVDAT